MNNKHWSSFFSLSTVFLLGVSAASIFLSGCTGTAPNYTLFREHAPRSVLVLPPVNQTTTVDASAAYLSTISTAVGEAGYYMPPIALVDSMLRENGVPTPEDMRAVPLKKLKEVFGADAVLYVTIEEWGTQYIVIGSTTRVRFSFQLVSTTSGTELWKRTIEARDSSHGGAGGVGGVLIGALTHALANSLSSEERNLAISANTTALLDDEGLLKGPYHPKHGSPQPPVSTSNVR